MIVRHVPIPVVCFYVMYYSAHCVMLRWPQFLGGSDPLWQLIQVLV